MFENFLGPDPRLIDQANQAHAVNFLALTILLLEKGIITHDELERAKSQATHFVEQEWARHREESEKQFDAEHPGIRKLFGSVLGNTNSEDQP